MSEPYKSPLGFPTGRVAATLRAILHRALRPEDIEVITVVLLGHLLVEDRLSTCLFDLLLAHMPRKGPIGDAETQINKAAAATERMEQELWDQVQRTNFTSKLRYLQPCFRVWYPDLPGKLDEINRVRNGVIHRLGREPLDFDGVLIWTEEGIERYFVATQNAGHVLDDFREMIAKPHEEARRWAERLKELGEPLA